MGNKARGRDKGKAKKSAKAAKSGLRPHEQRQQQDALNGASAQFMPRWEAGRQRRSGGAGGGDGHSDGLGDLLAGLATVDARSPLSSIAVPRRGDHNDARCQ